MKNYKIILNSFISIFITIICIVLFLKNSKSAFNIEDLILIIFAGWHYLVLACFLLIINVYLRSYRWKFLFNSDSELKINFLFSSQLIGYFINNILPIRIGDIGRSYVVSKYINKKTSYIIGTIAMERFLDIITILFFSLIVILHYGFDYLEIKYFFMNTNFLSWLLLFLVSSFIVYKFLLPRSLKNIFKNIWVGFSSIQLYHKTAIIIYSILIWSIYCFNVFLIQSMFIEFQLNIFDCLLILVSASLIQMIPIGFGGVGVFHLGVQGVLNRLGIQDYNNFIILAHLYSILVYTAFGGYFFFTEKFFNIRNIYNDFLKN